MLDTNDVDRVAVGKGTYQAGKPDWVEGRKEEREEEKERSEFHVFLDTNVKGKNYEWHEIHELFPRRIAGISQPRVYVTTFPSYLFITWRWWWGEEK